MAITLQQLIEARMTRRTLLGGASALLATAAMPRMGFGADEPFAPLPREQVQGLSLARGYEAQVLASWGDAIRADVRPFHPLSQSPDLQEVQFGYNCDYIAYMPLPFGSKSSTHGLLCVNHEYTHAPLMFPDYAGPKNKTRTQAAIELSAHGHSVLEIARTEKGEWDVVRDSPYNRRLSARTTYFTLTGPAAGSPRLRTAEDPTGTSVLGSLGNCAGGKTPWGTVLIAEENFNHYFGGTITGTPEYRNHRRYGVGMEDWYGWRHFYPRFDLDQEQNEANRFGWVVEYDPYEPAVTPVKRTALGRFKHESATVTTAYDGRIVVYSGDDERFEYLYRFVSRHAYDPVHREKNNDLLDDGVLYVARFDQDGLTWLPLTFGTWPLNEKEGFASQADVLIETRRAAELVGATPMDRPEDIEVHPTNGTVYVSLTNNTERKEANAPNPRVHNTHGHIIALHPPDGNHVADRFSWEITLLAGKVLSCPDNLAIDPKGRLWIATDGQPKTLEAADSLYMMQGEKPLRFLNAPMGAEVTGPEFTPDGTTLFVSIQHPGTDDDVNYGSPLTRWPSGPNSALPPRPSVVAIRRDDNGVIGG